MATQNLWLSIVLAVFRRNCPTSMFVFTPENYIRDSHGRMKYIKASTNITSWWYCLFSRNEFMFTKVDVFPFRTNLYPDIVVTSDCFIVEKTFTCFDCNIVLFYGQRNPSPDFIFTPDSLMYSRSWSLAGSRQFDAFLVPAPFVFMRN